MPNSKVSKKHSARSTSLSVRKPSKKTAKKKRSTKRGDEEEIQMSLELFNIDTADFHTVKQFLNVALGLGTPVCTSELATLITESTVSEHVGTTAKSEGERSDAYAFSSVIPLSQSSKLSDFFQSHISSVRPAETAFVCHERFLNLPSPVAYQLFVALKEDWEKAKGEEPRLFGAIKHVIMMTPVIRTAKEDFEHEYGEAELIDDLASKQATFQVLSTHDSAESRCLFGEDGVEKWRRIYLLSVEAWLAYVDRIGVFVNS